MIAIFYDKYLNFISRYYQDDCPNLSTMGLDDVVLAFDQSTKCSGITVGNSKGTIYGYIRLIKEHHTENGGIYVANFQRWLTNFVDQNLTYLIYEHTFSKQYFHTDVVLSQLRGTFNTVKKLKGWEFPVESVKQQVWKSCLISLKGGDHSLTKENAKHVITHYLLPSIKDDDEYEDVYDSIGIYYYYFINLREFDTSVPVDITTKLKIDDKLSFKYYIYTGTTPQLESFSRICSSRGVRTFNYSLDMSPREQIVRLASNSNEVWYTTVPFENNNHLDLILQECGRLPLPEENVYLLGYREKVKKFSVPVK